MSQTWVLYSGYPIISMIYDFTLWKFKIAMEAMAHLYIDDTHYHLPSGKLT